MLIGPEGTPLTAPDNGNANADEAPRPLTAGKRRFLAWGIALLVVGGYLIFQLFSVWTVKDAVPPASLITAPAGATIVGEPRISREPYRATTYVTIRPAYGHNHVDLMREMGLSEQPTQIT
ncbi:MAG: hypothetical protein WBX17_08790, partial [Microbacterium sp.]